MVSLNAATPGRSSIGGRPRTALAGVLLVVAVLGTIAVAALGGLLAAPPRIDQPAAITLARDFFAHAHGEGATVSNVQILSIALGADDAGHTAWRVNISGDVTEAGRTSPDYTSYMWLYVDAETGSVRVFAQG